MYSFEDWVEFSLVEDRQIGFGGRLSLQKFGTWSNS